MREFLPKPADEPLYWLMFGAGGMVASMVLPAILVIFIVAGLTGPDMNSGVLNFNQMSGVLGNWFLSVVLFGVVFMLCMYSLHRMYHSSHDFGFHSKIFWFAFYGAAAALSFICFGLQFLIYCKLF